MTFRHAERTTLNTDALLRIIKTYTNLLLPVVVSFDRQINDHGTHVALERPNGQEYHYIRISVRMTEHLDDRSQAFDLISTLLHELQHADQWERLGPEAYEDPSFACAGTPNARTDDFYSSREIQARTFENANLAGAMQCYEQFVAEIQNRSRTRPAA